MSTETKHKLEVVPAGTKQRLETAERRIQVLFNRIQEYESVNEKLLAKIESQQRQNAHINAQLSNIRERLEESENN